MTGGPAYDVDAVLDALRASVGSLVEVDYAKVVHELGTDRVLNVVLLGAAARAGVLGLSIGDLESAIRKLLPERFHELNLRALRVS